MVVRRRQASCCLRFSSGNILFFFFFFFDNCIGVASCQLCAGCRGLCRGEGFRFPGSWHMHFPDGGRGTRFLGGPVPLCFSWRASPKTALCEFLMVFVGTQYRLVISFFFFFFKLSGSLFLQLNLMISIMLVMLTALSSSSR